MKRQLNYLMMVVLVLALAGCASFTSNAYKTLGTSKQAYDSSLSIAGDFYAQGQITEAQKEKIIEYGNLYLAAHNQAVAALLAYETNPTEDHKQKYIDLAADAFERLATMLDYVKPYLSEEK